MDGNSHLNSARRKLSRRDVSKTAITKGGYNLCCQRPQPILSLSDSRPACLGSNRSCRSYLEVAERRGECERVFGRWKQGHRRWWRKRRKERSDLYKQYLPVISHSVFFLSSFLLPPPSPRTPRYISLHSFCGPGRE